MFAPDASFFFFFVFLSLCFRTKVQGQLQGGLLWAWQECWILPWILDAAARLNPDLPFRPQGLYSRTLSFLLLRNKKTALTTTYLKPVAEWSERLMGRCFPVVTFICRITGEEFDKDKTIHNVWKGSECDQELHLIRNDKVRWLWLYLRSPVCRCTWPCRIPWHLVGFGCSTARSEHLSRSRQRWDQPSRDIYTHRLV